MFHQCMQLVREYPTVSFVAMIALFACIGYLIVTRYLMEKRIRNFLPKTIFIITFSCSVGLLAVYLYEISLITLNENLWDLILYLQVIMCTVVIPIFILLKLPYATYQVSFGGNIRLPIASIAIIVLYLRVLAYWSNDMRTRKGIDEDIRDFTKEHINILVELLMHYGVILMAIMSAYGAVWCPYIYFNHTDSKREDLIKAKNKIKKEIFFLIEQIKKNKYAILELKEKEEKILALMQDDKQQANKSPFFIQGLRAIRNTFGNKKTEELGKIREQVKFHQEDLKLIHDMHHSSFSAYREIISEEKKHIISETFMGRLFRLFSLVLVLYSISKFVLTAWNMVIGRKLSTDPITRIFNFFSWFLSADSNSELRTYCQYISFGFMGYLMISSVRSFSINTKNFIDFMLRRRRLNILSTDTLVLLLSELYGIYFLSAVILLQSGLPRTYVTNFEQITGKVELVEHFTWFDKLFFWGCLLSLLFIYISENQRKQTIKTIKERNPVQVFA